MRNEAPSLRILPWAIFVFALLVRLAVTAGTIGFSTPAASEPAYDSRIHMALVHSLLGGHGFSYHGTPTAMTPPLYILLLAGLYELFGDPAVVRIAQAVFGATSCVLLYAIGRKTFDPATGLIAAALLSVHPLAVYVTGLHLTENLFLPVLSLMLLLSTHVMERPALVTVAGLGGMIGLDALTRAMFTTFIPFLLLWTISFWGIRNPLAYRVFGLAAVTAVLVIFPWTVRNYLVLGSIVPVQSNVGAVFWAGNNPYADGGLAWATSRTWTSGPPPDDGVYGWRGLSVPAQTQRYLQAAITWIRGHPRDYAGLLARKLGRLYEFSRAADAQAPVVPPAVKVFHVLFLVSAAAGILITLPRWRRVSLLLILVIFTNVMTLLFHGGTRYTIPMIPSLALFSGVALAIARTYVLRALRPNRIAVSI